LIELVERKVWVEDLARELKSDHEEIRRQEWVLKMLVYRGEYAFALRRAEELQVFLGQHFLKEESGFRYVLVHEKRGRAERNDVSLEKLIQRHKEMTNSLQEMAKSGGLSTEAEKLKVFDLFEGRFLGLLKEEEEEAGANIRLLV